MYVNIYIQYENSVVLSVTICHFSKTPGSKEPHPPFNMFRHIITRCKSTLQVTLIQK